MTQRDMIYNMLVNAGERGITPVDALGEAGCFRLAARIKELRDEGIDIYTKSHHRQSGRSYARYVLGRYMPGIQVGDKISSAESNMLMRGASS